MKFKLAFAVHNHQPVGNFNAVFEDAHTNCYNPFLKTAQKYPEIKFSLHQSGILWNWQKEHHSEYFELVGKMVDAGQLELLSGAFYEPILPAIPDRDKLGQLEMMNDYLKNHFEVTPRGMWLAERVWEPNLPSIINQAGLHFLALDDTHFRYAGIREDQLFGTYITEDAGRPLTLLPILQKLRYAIPFEKPAKIIEYLREVAAKYPEGMAVYADDGEKFGVWPKTFEHCYTDGWLDQFFSLLNDNSDWLEVISLGEAVEKSKPLGRVYLPSASYDEMSEWSLPADAVVDYEEFEELLKQENLDTKFGRFVKGGHWRGFLAKYDEVNLMHKKMIKISDLLHQAETVPQVDQHQLQIARDLLYAGQCNCPYWHGVFGGLYLPHLRWAIYRKLIQAEKIVRHLLKAEVYSEFEDRTRDGRIEIAVGGENLSMVIAPGKGGQILELNCLDKNINLTDTLARRREGYHRRLLNRNEPSESDNARSIHERVEVKEEGLEKLLVEDWYMRRPLTDHFLAEGTTVESFAAGNYYELGDFVLEPYESSFVENGDNYQISLSRSGHVWQGDTHCPLRLGKIITFPKVGYNIKIEYRLRQEKLEILPIRFGVEFDFNFLAPDAEDRYAIIDGIKPKNYYLSALHESKAVSEITYIDEYQSVALSISSSEKGRLWRAPINTVSLSEGGFEKVLQGNCSMFVFDKALASGREMTICFDLFAGPHEKFEPVNKTEKPLVNKL